MHDKRILMVHVELSTLFQLLQRVIMYWMAQCAVFIANRSNSGGRFCDDATSRAP